MTNKETEQVVNRCILIYQQALKIKNLQRLTDIIKASDKLASRVRNVRRSTDRQFGKGTFDAIMKRLAFEIGEGEDEI